MPGWAGRAQKRARNAEEAEEAASILMDLSDEPRFCEVGMNTVSDVVKLSGDVVAFRRMTSPNFELVTRPL